MKWAGTGNWGMLLLAIWLIVQGVTAFVDIAFPQLGVLLSALAIAAGVLILLGR